MANRWSRAQRLQAIVGERGWTGYRSIVALDRRPCGWWFAPTLAVDGCGCDYCEAARAGDELYLAAGIVLAAAVLGRYLGSHPAPDG